MELGTREILLAVGLLLIVVIVLDGIRRLRQSGHGQIRMARRQRVFDDNDNSFDPYGGEVSSEVRIRERGEREAPAVRARPVVPTQQREISEGGADDSLLSRSASRARGDETPRRSRREAEAHVPQGQGQWQDQGQERDDELLREPRLSSGRPASDEVLDWQEQRRLEEEEQAELMLDMPQQEAFDLNEELDPAPVRASLRRQREEPPPAADDFEQDILDATTGHAVAQESAAARMQAPPRRSPSGADTEPAAAPDVRRAAPDITTPAHRPRTTGRARASHDDPRDGPHDEPHDQTHRDAPMPEVIALHVMARRSAQFHGDDLLNAFMDNDLRYGSMKIFHRHQAPDGVGPVLFSLANTVKPGTFDLNAMHDFRTSGVSLFMALDDLENPSDAFEQLLEVAHNLARELGGELKDESRSALTRQTEDHCRQRIKEFERRRLYRTTRL